MTNTSEALNGEERHRAVQVLFNHSREHGPDLLEALRRQDSGAVAANERVQTWVHLHQVCEQVLSAEQWSRDAIIREVEASLAPEPVEYAMIYELPVIFRGSLLVKVDDINGAQMALENILRKEKTLLELFQSCEITPDFFEMTVSDYEYQPPAQKPAAPDAMATTA